MPEKKLKFLIINNYSRFASKDVWNAMVQTIKVDLKYEVLSYAVESMQAFFSNDIQQHHIVSTAVSSRNKFTHIIFIGSAFIEKWCIDTIREHKDIKIIYWSLEDPHAFDQNSRFMDVVDYYFTNEHAVAKQFPDKAFYLPTAGGHLVCAPAPCSLKEIKNKEYRETLDNDVVFCGNIYPNRRKVLEPLVEMCEKEKIKLGVMGVTNMMEDNGKSRLRDYIKGGLEGIIEHEWFIAAYAYAKFVINIERESDHEYDSRFCTNRKYNIKGESLNPRAYEIALTGGGLQLIDESRKEIFEPGILEPGKHCVTYRSTADMFDCIKYYLAHDDERLKIVKAAREHALKNHTYLSRAKRMIDIINWKEDRKEKVINEAISKIFSGSKIQTK